MFRDLCRSSPWKWQSLRFEYWDEPFAVICPQVGFTAM